MRGTCMDWKVFNKPKIFQNESFTGRENLKADYFTPPLKSLQVLLISLKTEVFTTPRESDHP